MAKGEASFANKHQRKGRSIKGFWESKVPTTFSFITWTCRVCFKIRLHPYPFKMISSLYCTNSRLNVFFLLCFIPKCKHLGPESFTIMDAKYIGIRLSRETMEFAPVDAKWSKVNQCFILSAITWWNSFSTVKSNEDGWKKLKGLKE